MRRIIVKIVTMVLMASLILSSTVYAADQGKTANDKVKVLDDINIFKGDGSGYNLDQKLKRSEAATLIVRLMGKTSEVEGNKAKYSSTKFNDVAKEDWFAPYVGYCSQNNIILGFPDGSFKPQEYITEKAFTQLLLGVLGYTSGKDFDWDSVYNFSLEVGINDDVSYAFNNIDNVMYYRENAVAHIYNTLLRFKKGTFTRVIDDLVEAGITSADAARYHGLIIEDKTVTDISSINLTSAIGIRVSLNEEAAFDDGDVSVIYNGSKLEIESINKLPNFTEIVMKSTLDSKKNYELVINNLTDVDGNKVDSVKKSFKGFEIPRLKSPFFKISKVEPISTDKIRVYFTHPIGEDATQVLLYEFIKEGQKYFEGSYKNLNVTLDPSVDDAVIITSVGYTFDQGVPYSIKVRGDLKSSYGAYLNKGEGDENSFSGISVVSQPLKVIDVGFVDRDLIKVVFNGPVDEKSAYANSNYRITDTKTGSEMAPTRLYPYSDIDNAIILRFNGTKSDREYTLKVSDVSDVTKTSTVTTSGLELGQGLSDGISHEIVSVFPIDKSTLEIDFNMNLKEEAANCVMSLSGGLQARSRVIDKDDPTKMYVYLSKVKYLEEDKQYTVTIKSGLVDEYERRQRYSVSGEFPGTSMMAEETKLTSAYFISDNLIMIKFNKDVRTSDMSDIDKFEFIYKEGSINKTLFPTSVKVIDSKTVVLGYDYSFNGGAIDVVVKDYYNYAGDVKYSKSQITVQQ